MHICHIKQKENSGQRKENRKLKRAVKQEDIIGYKAAYKMSLKIHIR